MNCSSCKEILGLIKKYQYLLKDFDYTIFYQQNKLSFTVNINTLYYFNFYRIIVYYYLIYIYRFLTSSNHYHLI